MDFTPRTPIGYFQQAKGAGLRVEEVFELIAQQVHSPIAFRGGVFIVMILRGCLKPARLDWHAALRAFVIGLVLRKGRDRLGDAVTPTYRG